MAAAELSPRTQREGEGMRGSPAPFSADEDTILRRYAETRDPALKAELSARFLPLARALALRYRRASEPLDDLVQVASLGLVKALTASTPAEGSASSPTRRPPSSASFAGTSGTASGTSASRAVFRSVPRPYPEPRRNWRRRREGRRRRRRSRLASGLTEDEVLEAIQAEEGSSDAVTRCAREPRPARVARARGGSGWGGVRLRTGGVPRGRRLERRSTSASRPCCGFASTRI